jgi:hypothetical protein
MNKSTTVGAKDGANNGTKEEIICELKSSENPLSTSDLALRLKKAWHTIDRACLMLMIEHKIDGFKAGKMNLWRIK